MPENTQQFERKTKFNLIKISHTKKQMWPGNLNRYRNSRDSIINKGVKKKLFKICVHVCVFSYSSSVWLFVILWFVTLRLLCPWSSLKQEYGTGCYFLLQGTFLTGTKPLWLSLLQTGRQILLPLISLGKILGFKGKYEHIKESKL